MSAMQSVGAPACRKTQQLGHRKVKTILAAALGAAVALGAASGCAPRATGDVVTLAAHQEGKPYAYGAAGQCSQRDISP